MEEEKCVRDFFSFSMILTMAYVSSSQYLNRTIIFLKY